MRSRGRFEHLFFHPSTTGMETVPVESEAHITERYVAVRTFAGWINVWARDNNQGQPRGVLFCHLVWNWK